MLRAGGSQTASRLVRSRVLSRRTTPSRVTFSVEEAIDKGKEMTFAVLIYRIEKGARVIEKTISGFESRHAAKEWVDLIKGDAEWADLIESEAQYSIIEID
jgi:hypothetical protein